MVLLNSSPVWSDTPQDGVWGIQQTAGSEKHRDLPTAVLSSSTPPPHPVQLPQPHLSSSDLGREPPL